MRILLITLATIAAAGCALPQKQVSQQQGKAGRIEACIGRISDISDANIEQAFEVCRQLHRLRKLE
jgi:hypothetical protein